MWESLLKAICLLFIIEGIMPFLYPSKWRSLVALLASISDRQLRIMGLFSMGLGLILLYLFT
jgi:uncharacterized protein YjeT (DUF2065 family)